MKKKKGKYMWQAEGLFAGRIYAEKSLTFIGIKHVQSKQSAIQWYIYENREKKWKRQGKHPIYCKNYISGTFISIGTKYCEISNVVMRMLEK